MKVQNKKSSHQTNSYLKYALLCEQAYYLVVLQPIFFLISLRIGCRGLFCIIPSYNCSIVLVKCKAYCLALASILCFKSETWFSPFQLTVVGHTVALRMALLTLMP